MTNGGTGGFTSVVGIAFLPDTLKTLTSRMIENMGFRPANRDRFLRFEAVGTNGGAPLEPTLYFYDKSTTNRIVTLAKLNADCTRRTATNIVLDKGIGAHPRYVIPAISGCGAIRVGLADASNSPDAKAFQRPSQFQQARRPAYAR